MSDAFDFMAKKIVIAMVETAYALDESGFDQKFKAAGILALEEFYFRATGQHFDWEDFKLADKAYQQKLFDAMRAAAAQPGDTAAGGS